jgi:hypothetical protein
MARSGRSPTAPAHGAPARGSFRLTVPRDGGRERWRARAGLRPRPPAVAPARGSFRLTGPRDGGRERWCARAGLRPRPPTVAPARSRFRLTGPRDGGCERWRARAGLRPRPPSVRLRGVASVLPAPGTGAVSDGALGPVSDRARLRCACAESLPSYRPPGRGP